MGRGNLENGPGKIFWLRGGFMTVDIHHGSNGNWCRFIFCFLAVVLTWLLPSAISTTAQSTGGRIRGTVIDPSAGAVSGAKLVLTNEANGTQRDTQSGANGEYIFLEVPIGTYQIEVSQQGFKKYFRKGLLVNLNEVLSLATPLQLGGRTAT